jgi:hypothetical protein
MPVASAIRAESSTGWQYRLALRNVATQSNLQAGIAYALAQVGQDAAALRAA